MTIAYRPEQNNRQTQLGTGTSEYISLEETCLCKQQYRVMVCGPPPMRIMSRRLEAWQHDD